MSRPERKVLLDRVVDENSKDGQPLRQSVKDRLDRYYSCTCLDSLPLSRSNCTLRHRSCPRLHVFLVPATCA